MTLEGGASSNFGGFSVTPLWLVDVGDMGGEMQTRRGPLADREYKQNDWTSHRHGGDDRHEKKVPAAREQTHRQSDRQIPRQNDRQTDKMKNT